MSSTKPPIFALFPNENKKQSINIALSLQEFLTGQGVHVVAPDDKAEMCQCPPLSSVDPADISFLISMGGDGTILRLLHSREDLLHCAIIGINLGTLGFMADVPLSDIYPSLQDVLNGNYYIEQRLIMEGVTPREESCYAVNEMVVHRAQNPTLIDLAIHVDGEYVNTFSADGVIISTPSGSTAYSLASGGPILTPELEALVLTPISPHTISNRPIVFMPKEEIQIQYLTNNLPVEITFDGISCYTLNTDEVFRMRKSSKTFNLVKLPRRDYYSTLRRKLGWSGGRCAV